MITGTERQLTVMFGARGVGLSSLVHAKLLPALERLYYQPVHIRVYSEQEDPLATTRRNIVGELRKWQPDLPDFQPQQTLTEFAATHSLLKGLIKPVLFFDNFDELFGQGKEQDRHGVSPFLIELGDLIEMRLPDNVRSIETLGNAARFTVVLCMRQEWLVYLDDYAAKIPSLLQNRFRLKEFDADQAKKVIMGMGVLDKKAIVTGEAAQSIIQQLGQPEPNSIEVRIDPGELSIYCYELFEQASRTPQLLIDAPLVAKYPFTGMLRDYYEQSAKKDQKIANLIGDRLITSNGIRVLMPLDRFIAGSDVTQEAVLDFARQTGILRIIRHNIIPDVELINDKLAAQIASLPKNIPVVPYFHLPTIAPIMEFPIAAYDIPPPRARRRFVIPAVTSLLVVGVGLYFYTSRLGSKPPVIPASIEVVQSVPPHDSVTLSNKAVSNEIRLLKDTIAMQRATIAHLDSLLHPRRKS
jgi:hypothetical protein